MVFELIRKIVEEFKEQQRLAIARAQAASVPLAQFAAPGEPKKKKRKKKGHQHEEASVPQPERPAPRPAPVEEAILVVANRENPSGLNGRDPRKLFIWGEIIGPPLALREDEG